MKVPSQITGANVAGVERLGFNSTPLSARSFAQFRRSATGSPEPEQRVSEP